jgi:hypothetical protein
MEPRRRAPRRAGHRTTLTVPHSVLDTANRLAQELGTTANDAIVRLAQEGATARERREQLMALASERRAAAESVDSGKALAFLSADEFREAMLAGRRDP